MWARIHVNTTSVDEQVSRRQAQFFTPLSLHKSHTILKLLVPHTVATNIMKFPKSHNQLKTTPKRHKNRLSEDQLRLLEASFTHEKKLEPERKFQLAYELGLPPKQVAIWYQNKRARWKTQNIELDYRAIQLRLDSVLADRGRLQKEVMRLRMELQRSQEALYAMNLNQPPIPSLNTSCEEDGSSSLPSDANCPWENTDALRVDEVYAFLMGTSDQTSMLQTNNSLFNPASS